MDFDVFVRLLSEVALFLAQEDSPMSPQADRNDGRDFLLRLYACFAKGKPSLTFEDVAVGFGFVKKDVMGKIEWLFSLYDDAKGYLTNDEIIKLSEGLLFLTRHEQSDEKLKSMSLFLNACYEFCDKIRESEISKSVFASLSNEQTEPTVMKLSLSALRAVILADEYLEGFFDKRFEAAFLGNVKHAESKSELVTNERQMILNQLWNSTRSFVKTRTMKLLKTNEGSNQTLQPDLLSGPAPVLIDSAYLAGIQRSINSSVEFKPATTTTNVSLTANSDQSQTDEILQEVDKLLEDLDVEIPEGETTTDVEAFFNELEIK